MPALEGRVTVWRMGSRWLNLQLRHPQSVREPVDCCVAPGALTMIGKSLMVSRGTRKSSARMVRRSSGPQKAESSVVLVTLGHGKLAYCGSCHQRSCLVIESKAHLL